MREQKKNFENGFKVLFNKSVIYECYCPSGFDNEIVLGQALYGESITGIEVRRRMCEEYIEIYKKILSEYNSLPWYKRVFIQKQKLLKSK